MQSKFRVLQESISLCSVIQKNMEKRGNKNFEISILFTYVPIKERQL